ncbi:MAG: hypothetical protein IKI02_10125 [Oscillospiraceae bacterium]|nr:hypothetical protein [Oscillospiraceae bacterium]
MAKRILSLTLILIFVLGLTACGGGEKQPSPSGGKPGESQAAPDTAAAPAETAAPAPALPQPKGADSVKTLMELSLDYFHSGCDYSKIAEHHDPRAYLAWFMMEDFYDEEDMSLDQAMEKAALVYGSAEELETKDPRLADMIRDEMDVEDPNEALSEYMNDLRSAFRNGEITEDNPNYEKLSALLTDWDKGADYVFEHYPELLEGQRERGYCFSLEEALEQLRRMARFEIFRNREADEIFKTLECEYRPENTYVDESGVCSYDMGYVVDGYDAWSVDMLYYVKDAQYYLIGYHYVLGSTGG